ncbi:MAG: transcriptional regulator, LuxR family [Frankiales bacterium]|nr:transcriptional regulator, LuxR family [Frankiales bacterium]
MTVAPVLHLAEIAARPGPLPERAQALLHELARHVPFDASWIGLVEPPGTGYTSLASTDLDQRTVAFLSGPKMSHDIEATGANRARPPGELPTWAECLIPAGFHEALAVALFVPRARHVGFLALLYGGQPPAEAVRRRLTRLSPILAGGIDPMRSLLTVARLVESASAGVVLYNDGGSAPLPGLTDDALLAPGSAVLGAARAAIDGRQVYTSFLWPRGGRHAPDGHVRVTVLAGTDDVSSVLPGIVLLSPAGDLRGLTPRELEVLGRLIDGCANQEIARALVVAPRTVAAHLEHIRVKLGAPSRTLAAVRAERDGLYVPAVA